MGGTHTMVHRRRTHPAAGQALAILPSKFSTPTFPRGSPPPPPLTCSFSLVRICQLVARNGRTRYRHREVRVARAFHVTNFDHLQRVVVSRCIREESTEETALQFQLNESRQTYSRGIHPNRSRSLGAMATQINALQYIQEYMKKTSIRHTSGSLVRAPRHSEEDKQTRSKRPRDRLEGGHVLGYTSGRWCHRLDVKDVACVNMRDSS
ncbi:hypothetical protein C8Q77DRAFT_192588 [Trametes polyzona]|nr:hypothetical protein C8Q77DRAFT_192588 [Trametes polyzona]